jgi:hypothetical protein
MYFSPHMCNITHSFVLVLNKELTVTVLSSDSFFFLPSACLGDIHGTGSHSFMGSTVCLVMSISMIRLVP